MGYQKSEDHSAALQVIKQALLSRNQITKQLVTVVYTHSAKSEGCLQCTHILQSAEYLQQSAEYLQQSADFMLQSADHLLQSADHLMQSADHLQQSAEYLQQSAEYLQHAESAEYLQPVSMLQPSCFLPFNSTKPNKGLR